MDIHKLSGFTKGWFVGDFVPTIVPTKDFEVSIKRYMKGDKEAKHVHKVAWEITAVVSGKYIMAGKEIGADDIVYLAPDEPADFECLEEGVTVVVKAPSAKGDKYLV
ncbi:MAG: hypothetical protein JNN11_04380 [Candidatus Doudnabacteria bacterium]|nr:hypothetical protein [Candidatus Doudnabacteria bacterium]